MARNQLGPSGRAFMATRNLIEVITETLPELDELDIADVIMVCQRAIRCVNEELNRRDAEKYPACACIDSRAQCAVRNGHLLCANCDREIREARVSP